MRHFRFLLFLLCNLQALSQTSAAQQQAEQQRAAQQRVQDAVKQQADQREEFKKGEFLACHATKTAHSIFWGFWNPKPDKVNPISVSIQFTKPPDNMKDLDCTGQPLELTVPNGQEVLFSTYFDPDECKPSSTVTISIAKVASDNPVGDLLSIASKIGNVGLDGGHTYLLPELKNKILTIEATCNGDSVHKSVQTAIITYQSPPRVAVSSGLVFAHGVKSYGFKTTQTGVGSGGVVGFQNSIAITGSPWGQVIPFGFANIYYAGSRTLNLNAQLGLGVNPNLSTAKVEYFASPLALGWHDVYISPGVHIGKHENLTGGFAVGQLTPSNLSKVPIGWQAYTGFGISISYNLKPLVKSSSSNSTSPKKP